MILAAGFGKRLQPLTLDCPKPLLKIGNKTLLYNTLMFLKSIGIKKVIINTHYLKEQIIDYIKKNKFNLNISIVEEKDKILDTGGGILNAIDYFSGKPFIIINPDTLWNFHYLKQFKFLEKVFFENRSDCTLLIVNKKKSFDKSIKGDFNLKGNLVERKNKESLNYIYTGLQIMNPNIFSDITEKVFSINKIWNKLIVNKKLHSFESKVNFKHVSNLGVYKKLLKEFKN